MKILIVGGGPAGLALASFMGDYAEVTLVDKAPKWGDVGYAIALWGNGQKILDKLGVLDKVLKKSYEIPWDALEDPKGRVLKEFMFDTFKSFGATVVVKRTDLHMVLVEKINDSVKNINLKLGTTVSSFNNTKNGVGVVLSDGSTGDYDLVVGADGVHSLVREMVFGKNFLKKFGWTIWAFWTKPGESFSKGAVSVSNAGNFYFSYPMEDRAVVMLATTKNLSGKSNTEIKKELHEVFSDFGEIVSRKIDTISNDERIFRDELIHIDMNTWYDKRIILIGDAQHATSPLTGMGTSLALEDAYVLADELKKNININTALVAFSKRRTKRIKQFRKSSSYIESWIMTTSPATTFIRDIIIRMMPLSLLTSKLKSILGSEI